MGTTTRLTKNKPEINNIFATHSIGLGFESRPRNFTVLTDNLQWFQPLSTCKVHIPFDSSQPNHVTGSCLLYYDRPGPSTATAEAGEIYGKCKLGKSNSHSLETLKDAPRTAG